MTTDKVVFKGLDKTPGGLRALVGLLVTPFSCTQVPVTCWPSSLARRRRRSKGKGNEEAWKECIRRKAGSNKTTVAVLDSINEPCCLKGFKYKVMNRPS